MFVATLIILFSTLIIKIKSDRHLVWCEFEKKRILKNINELIKLYGSKQFYIKLKNLKKIYFNKSEKNRNKRKYTHLIEETLFELTEKDKATAPAIRAIAHEMEFTFLTINNLKKHNASHILRGCLQAKTYLYEPAIPYLLHHLRFCRFGLQYDLLLSLSRFDDPDVIVEAFEIIKDSVQVNERTIREIIKWMSPENQVTLISRIFEMKSEYLSSIFLKCISKHAALALSDELIPFFNEDNTKEIRVAAIRAMTVTEDPVFIPQLIEALKDPSWDIRAVAAKGLDGMTNEQTLQPLINAICDSEWWVRQNAALALLSYPDTETVISQVIETKDHYAYESLSYAAEFKDMKHILNNFDNLLLHEEELDNSNDVIITPVQKPVVFV